MNQNKASPTALMFSHPMHSRERENKTKIRFYNRNPWPQLVYLCNNDVKCEMRTFSALGKKNKQTEITRKL